MEYSGEGSKSTDNVAGIFVVNNTAAARFKLTEITMGNSTTPADATWVHQVARTSTDPTGTTVTMNPLDPADAAAGPTGFDAISVDATSGVILMSKALHQRATFRHVCQPGKELVAPATDNNGFEHGLSAADTTTAFQSEIWITT